MDQEHSWVERQGDQFGPLPSLRKAASTIAIAIGATVLAGWLFEIDTFKRGLPQFVAMNPATAISFILSGISFTLSTTPEATATTKAAGKALAGVVLLIGTAKLVGLILGWHPNVDEFLFSGKLSSAGAIPNRMAPNTALNFVFLGFALGLLNLPAKNLSPSQFFSLLVIFGSLLPITGYVYGVTSFTGFASFIPMAIHTALTFFILGLGLLLGGSNTTLSQIFATRDPRGVVARRLFPAAILLTLLLGWMRLKGEQRGFYDARFGTALFAVSLALILVILVAWTVIKVGKSDMERELANRALLESREELQEAVRQLEMIISHARELICTINEQGEILSMSAAAEAILGRAARDLIGQPFSGLHSPADQAVIEGALRKIVSGMQGAQFTASCRRRDSRFVPIVWSIQFSKHHRRAFCVGREKNETSDDLSPWHN